METIKCTQDILNIKENKFIGEAPVMVNSVINFRGQNNILFCEKGVKLRNAKINFGGSNSVVILRSSWHDTIIDVSIYNNSVLYIGQNNYFNGILHIIMSEEKNVIIGDSCLFSFDIFLRTADPHLIYSIETKKRINPSKSIFIGDHVWLGQGAFILKNSKVGSGSIVAAKALLSGKSVPSNESWGGNPAKSLSKGIFWEGSCVHSWTKDNAAEYETFDADTFIFKKTKDETVSMEEFDEKISSLKSSEEKFNFVFGELNEYKKNRFFIE